MSSSIIWSYSKVPKSSLRCWILIRLPWSCTTLPMRCHWLLRWSWGCIAGLRLFMSLRLIALLLLLGSWTAFSNQRSASFPSSSSSKARHPSKISETWICWSAYKPFAYSCRCAKTTRKSSWKGPSTNQPHGSSWRRSSTWSKHFVRRTSSCGPSSREKWK